MDIIKAQIRIFEFIWVLGIVILLFVIASCAPEVKTERACGFRLDQQGQRISLDGSVPVHLKIHESFPNHFKISIFRAIHDWEQALGKQLFIVDAAPIQGIPSPRQDGIFVIYWMNSWDPKLGEQQASTDIYSKGSKIIDADIRINATFQRYDYYIDSPNNYTQVHLESLIVHELGHVLGLEHVEVEGSVMRVQLPFNQKRTSIQSYDIENLKCEY